jgi:hypothetical protein
LTTAGSSKRLLGGRGINATFGGWNPAWPRRVGDALGESPHASEESDFMLLGRHHISVYVRVIVGFDGTEASLYAVNRAHAVPTEADSHVLVVSAYNPGPHRQIWYGLTPDQSFTARRQLSMPYASPSSI